MSRNWSEAKVLQTVKEVQAYLRDVHGLKLSRATVYRYATGPVEFILLPLHPGGRPNKGKGTRGVIPVEDLDDWVAARFHLRKTPPAAKPARSTA